MRTFRGGLALMLTLPILCAGIAIGLTSTALGEDPYEINAILPLTGIASFLGGEQSRSLALLENYVNKTGGIKGRPVKFVIGDDQSSPQVAVQLLNALVAHNVPVIVGPSIAGTCGAVSALVAANGPLQYCFSPGAHPPPGGYAFSASVSSFDLAAVTVHYFRDRGWTRVGLLSTTDGTGQDAEAQFKAAIALPENKSFAPVVYDHYATGDLSVSAQIAKMKAENLQVLLVYATVTPFGTALHAIADSGLDLPVLALGANMNFAEMKQFAAFLPKVVLFTASQGISKAGLAPSGPVRDAQTAYFKAFEEAGIKPDFINNLSWDPTLIVVDALRHVGTNARADQIHAYIENLRTWPGIDGVYNFTDKGQRGVAQAAGMVYRWDAEKNDFVPMSKGGGAQI